MTTIPLSVLPITALPSEPEIVRDNPYQATVSAPRKLSPLEQLERVLRANFYKPDTQAVRIVLGAIQAHRLHLGDPAWLFVVAPPGSGKTTMSIMGTCGLHDVVMLGGLKSKAAYKPLPLPQKLRDVFLELRGESKYCQDGDYVFTARNGKPVNLSNWGRRKLKPLQKRLGLPEISLHCFRHSHSTQLNALGTDPKTLQTQLRHANPEITLGRYTHQVPELQKAAVQQLEEELYRPEEKCQLFSTVLN